MNIFNKMVAFATKPAFIAKVEKGTHNISNTTIGLIVTIAGSLLGVFIVVALFRTLTKPAGAQKWVQLASEVTGLFAIILGIVWHQELISWISTSLGF